jgi:hypothetical protein
MRGHTLPNCWYLFKGKRPKGFKAGSVCMKKVRKRVKDDEDLAAQVERLKLSKLEEQDYS